MTERGIITSYNNIFTQGCTKVQAWGDVHHIPSPGAKLRQGVYLLGPV